MFELLAEALDAISKVESGEMSADDLKSHQVVVYRNYEETIALMQARVNMILLVALGKFSDRLDKTSTLIGAKVFPNQAPNYEAGFMQLNSAQKDYVLLVFDYASSTAEVLRSQGYEPEIIKELATHYNSLTFSTISDEDAGFSALAVGEQEVGREFLSAVREFFPEN